MSCRLSYRFGLLLICTVLTVHSHAQPPYGGTIFIDPDIITEEDSSAIVSTTYLKQEVVTMYDRRVPDWVSVNAYIFDVVWNDGLKSRAQINEEFGSLEAATAEAEKYAFLIGQLPYCLRIDVDQIWVHKGTNPYGGGNRSILIHTGQSLEYEKDGIIEETLVHEACHTSLDSRHASSPGWIEAQNKDGNFISTYARDFPTREDIAESFLPWMAVRYRKDKISEPDYNKITGAIPNRLLYFDSISCDLYPFETESESTGIVESSQYEVYPNPVSDILYLPQENISRDELKIYNILGQDISHLTRLDDRKLDMSELQSGYYVLRLRATALKLYKD